MIFTFYLIGQNKLRLKTLHTIFSLVLLLDGKYAYKIVQEIRPVFQQAQSQNVQ